jgi:hypothetical protein
VIEHYLAAPDIPPGPLFSFEMKKERPPPTVEWRAQVMRPVLGGSDRLCTVSACSESWSMCGQAKSPADANSDRCAQRAVAFMPRRYPRQPITDTVAGAGSNGREPMRYDPGDRVGMMLIAVTAFLLCLLFA